MMSNIKSNEFTDFYSYINSKWLKSFILQDQYARFGTFDQVSIKIELLVEKLIYNIVDIHDSYLSENELLLKKMYLKLSNNEIRNSNGIKPLEKYFKIIDDIENVNDYIKIMGLFNILNMGIFLNFNIERDIKNNSNYLLHCNQNSTILPSKKYYTEDSYQDIRIKYKKFIIEMLKIIDINKTIIDKDKVATEIFDFECYIASITLNPEQKRDTDLVYNISSYQEINSFLNLDECFYYFKNLRPDINQYYNKIIIDDLKYIKRIGAILLKIDLNFLKIYMKYIVLLSMPNILSNDIFMLKFNFFSKELTGTLVPREPIKQTIKILSNIIGEIIGEIFVKKYFPKELKDQVEILVHKIKLSSNDIIQKCKWMDSITKKKAIQKINKMVIKIGYPDKIKDYSSISKLINRTESEILLFDSMIMFNIFYAKFYLNKLGTKPDLTEWHMNSYETNAYYNPISNEIVFPAGILQPPFFDPNASFESNLGSIGSIIAHEISHGFDDQGRKYDVTGNMKTWWSNNDEIEFNKQTKYLVNQFDKIKLLDTKVSGQMTLGENLADYTGVTIITNVLKMQNIELDSNKYKDLYKAYAKLWKQKIRSNEVIRRLNIDVHAPARLRTNQVLSNIPEFYKVYNILEDHPMYIKPDLRIKLWI